MKTGLRPMRSDRVAQSGMAASATMLATMRTASILVRLMPTSFTA